MNSVSQSIRWKFIIVLLGSILIPGQMANMLDMID